MTGQLGAEGGYHWNAKFRLCLHTLLRFVTSIPGWTIVDHVAE